MVEQLDRLAPTPADFQQHLLISDASLGAILTGLLSSRKLGEFCDTWFDMTEHQLQRLRRNASVYTKLWNTLYDLPTATDWLPQVRMKYRRLFDREMAGLQAQRRSGTQGRRSELDDRIDILLEQHVNRYMVNDGAEDFSATRVHFIELLGRTLNEIFAAKPHAYSDCFGTIIKITHSNLHRWRPADQQTLFDMILSSLNWHREPSLFSNNAERLGLND